MEENATGPERLEKFLDSRYFVAVCLVLVAVISFALGRVSKIQENRQPVRVVSGGVGEVKGVNTSPRSDRNQSRPSHIAGEEKTASPESIQVVGSKNGTKYHLPTCPGAKQISEKNKITFNSIEEARAKGYTPASNCKGLK